MKTVAIIQARMSSTRLPGKVLKKIGDKRILEWVVDRVRKTERIDEIVVATTKQPEDDEIVGAAKEMKVLTFRGSLNDVLNRYYEAAAENKADIIVRITSDCPFVDPGVVDKVVFERQKRDCDYCSNTLIRSYPRGMDVEVFTFESLSRAQRYAETKEEREHVTPFIWLRPAEFDLVNVLAPKHLNRPTLRITVDTEEDYMLTKAIHHFLGDSLGLENILELMDKQPWLPWINKSVCQKKFIMHSSEKAKSVVQFLEGARSCYLQEYPKAGCVLLQQAEDLIGTLEENDETNILKSLFREIDAGVGKDG